jgi:hypothetical protein
MDEVQKPVIPNVIHHHQNPLESTWYNTISFPLISGTGSAAVTHLRTMVTIRTTHLNYQNPEM